MLTPFSETDWNGYKLVWDGLHLVLPQEISIHHRIIHALFKEGIASQAKTTMVGNDTS